MVLMEPHHTEPNISSPHVSSETADASTRPHKSSKKTQIRTCIVTREEHHKSDLLRFVINRDGVLYFDQTQKLPGRGIYLSPSRKNLDQALKQNLFSKSAKRKIVISDDFDAQVNASLRDHLLSYVGLAKRSGDLIASLSNIEKFIKNNKVSCYITSSSQESDGYSKIVSKIGSSVPVVSEFSNDELSKILGLDNAVHLVLKEGELSKTFLKKHKLYKEFIDNKDGQKKEEKNG